MKIEIQNRQKQVIINRPMIRKITALLMTCAAKRSATSWDEISLVITDDNGIRPVNKAYMSHDTATDVVSIAFAPTFPHSPLCGEIIVNARRAAEVAHYAHWTPSQELALYIAHGCDHLSGEDDTTPEEQKRMHRRELRWLRLPSINPLTKKLINLQ